VHAFLPSVILAKGISLSSIKKRKAKSFLGKSKKPRSSEVFCRLEATPFGYALTIRMIAERLINVNSDLSPLFVRVGMTDIPLP